MYSQLNLTDCQYEWFDFHHECRNMKWKNISILISKIDSFLESKDYFRFLVECAPKKQDITQTESKEDAKLISNITLLQSGCVRTNCMDCLDRTNVVQSVISKRILLKQLRNFDVIKESMIDKSDPFFSFPGSLEKGFREIWTNHANQLSMLYSGTCAQKNRFHLNWKKDYKGCY